jgi:hypothetical protein
MALDHRPRANGPRLGIEMYRGIWCIRFGDSLSSRSIVLSHRTCPLHARHEQRRQIVLPTVGLLNRNLRNVAASGQNKIRMFYPVIPPVGHSDHEWHERMRVQQLTNTCLHASKSTSTILAGRVPKIQGRTSSATAAGNVRSAATIADELSEPSHCPANRRCSALVRRTSHRKPNFGSVIVNSIPCKFVAARSARRAAKNCSLGTYHPE